MTAALLDLAQGTTPGPGTVGTGRTVVYAKTDGALYFMGSDGVEHPFSGAVGTVTNSGGALTLNQLLAGNAGADAKALAALGTDGAGKLIAGVPGSVVGAVQLANGTSGTVTLQPVTGALGARTLLIPAENGTLLSSAQLGTNVAPFLLSPTSAALLAAITDETGSGALVFGTSPTIDSINSTGVRTEPGAFVTTAAVMAALAIDVTKDLNTKNVVADSTFTFSATPATANTWFSVHVTNTDTNPHTLTIPSSFSLVTQANRTAFVIPAGGQLRLTFRYDGAAYHVFGDGQYFNNFAATANPAVTDDVSKGYGPGSLWGNTTSNVLYWCETSASGAAVWNTTGTGGGTVTNTSGALGANLLVVGNGTADVKTLAAISAAGGAVSLGTAGSVVGTVVMANATSGTITIQPVAGALGATVLTAPAGSATIVTTLAGSVNSATLSGMLTDETGTGVAVFNVNPTISLQKPAANSSIDGVVIGGYNANATIAQYQAVTMGASGWVLADADGTGTLRQCRGLAAAAGTTGNPMPVLKEGIARLDSWTWTPNGDIYLTTTPGGISQTAPSSGADVRRIGWAISATEIMVDLDSFFVTV